MVSPPIIPFPRLRWDYFSEDQENLTSFSYLRKHGTVIPTVQPVFPTEDYPAWTSIATGKINVYCWDFHFLSNVIIR